MNEPKNANGEKLPLKKALIYIALSVVVVIGSTSLGLIYFNYIKNQQKQDSFYQIAAIVQTSPDREGLKTVYLAELLELSVDFPTNLFRFDTNEAKAKLLKSPVIKEASVNKIRPQSIHVDYTMRKPIAYIGDYSNTAIDSEGVLFPFKPFFTPKKLPEIFLGPSPDNRQIVWGEKLIGKNSELAFSALKYIQEYCCDEVSFLKSIDVSKAFALSYGQRQIVIIIEERYGKMMEDHPVLCIYPRILRLSPENYKKQLVNYLGLRTHLRAKNLESSFVDSGTTHAYKPVIIDLRLDDLAFLNFE